MIHSEKRREPAIIVFDNVFYQSEALKAELARLNDPSLTNVGIPITGLVERTVALIDALPAGTSPARIIDIVLSDPAVKALLEGEPVDISRHLAPPDPMVVAHKRESRHGSWRDRFPNNDHPRSPRDRRYRKR